VRPGSIWVLAVGAATLIIGAFLPWVTLEAGAEPSTTLLGIETGGRATVVIGLVVLGLVATRWTAGVDAMSGLATVVLGALASFIAAAEVVRTRRVVVGGEVVDVGVATHVGLWSAAVAGVALVGAALWADREQDHRAFAASPGYTDDEPPASSSCPFCGGPREDMGFDDVVSAGLDLVPLVAFASALMASVSNGDVRGVFGVTAVMAVVMIVNARQRFDVRRGRRSPEPTASVMRKQVRHRRRTKLVAVAALVAAMVTQVILWSAGGALVFIVVFAFSIHVALVAERHAPHHPELMA
jgi:hypothetical protein